MSGSSSISKLLPPALAIVASEWIGRSCTLIAPAKINLRLKVEGRRADGYHLLSMVNCTTSLSDTIVMVLTAEPECSVELEPHDVLPMAGGENLVSRAFRAFFREFGFAEVSLGCSCFITKRIPVGGGLGGGSADAGAVLRHLTNIFGSALREELALTEEEYRGRIFKAALSCGADVPYAYVGGLCLVRGIGEEVLPIITCAERAPAKVLVMVPPVSVSTVSFYDLYRREHPVIPKYSDEVARKFVTGGALGDLSEIVENDFEATAIKMAPEIGEGLRLARELFPRGTALTGSGSVFFSLVGEEQEGGVFELTARLAARGVRSYLCTVNF